MNKKMVGLFATALLLGIVVRVPVYGWAQKKKETPQPTNVRVTAAVPSLAALAETPQTQLKGGLRITVTPETYQAREDWGEKQTPTDPPRISRWVPIITPPSPDAVYVERTKSVRLVVSPYRLTFQFHLSNQMPRVFRGSGIAVQFNIAGKTIASDSSGYGDLVNIILPPRSEQDITILGPPITNIPAPCTIGLFLFDVVTNMDEAGNVTGKQNFEWYFSYQTQTIDKEISIPPPEKGWIVPRPR
jgi:hypothetical protein